MRPTANAIDVLFELDELRHAVSAARRAGSL
jgi:hypothetical protein